MLPFDATLRTPLVFQCGIHYDAMPRVPLGLTELRFPETLEYHLLTGHTPLPGHLLPVENPADPPFQFRCREINR